MYTKHRDAETNWAANLDQASIHKATHQCTHARTDGWIHRCTDAWQRHMALAACIIDGDGAAARRNGQWQSAAIDELAQVRINPNQTKSVKKEIGLQHFSDRQALGVNSTYVIFLYCNNTYGISMGNGEVHTKLVCY